MNRDDAIAVLRSIEGELRADGVLSISLFGSVARGEESAGDVDVAVHLVENFSARGFNYFARLTQLQERLSGLLSCKVDVVKEPVRKTRFQSEIDEDRAIAF